MCLWFIILFSKCWQLTWLYLKRSQEEFQRNRTSFITRFIKTCLRRLHLLMSSNDILSEVTIHPLLTIDISVRKSIQIHTHTNTDLCSCAVSIIHKYFSWKKIQCAWKCFCCIWWDLFLFLIFIYLFIYLWLHWVFIAGRRLSLVVVIRGYISLRCAGFLLRWLRGL